MCEGFNSSEKFPLKKSPAGSSGVSSEKELNSSAQRPKVDTAFERNLLERALIVKSSWLVKNTAKHTVYQFFQAYFTLAKASWPCWDRQLFGALKNFPCNLVLCAEWLKIRITGTRNVYHLSLMLCRKSEEKNVMANLRFGICKRFHFVQCFIAWQFTYCTLCLLRYHLTLHSLCIQDHRGWHGAKRSVNLCCKSSLCLCLRFFLKWQQQ